MRPWIGGEGSLVFEPKVFPGEGNKSTLVKMRLACEVERRNKDTGAYEKVDPVFVTVACWGKQAEQLVESVVIGDWVVFAGELDQRTYETEGVRKIEYEVNARTVGVSTRFTAALTAKRRAEQTSPSHSGTAAATTDEPPF